MGYRGVGSDGDWYRGGCYCWFGWWFYCFLVLVVVAIFCDWRGEEGREGWDWEGICCAMAGEVDLTEWNQVEMGIIMKILFFLRLIFVFLPEGKHKDKKKRRRGKRHRFSSGISSLWEIEWQSQDSWRWFMINIIREYFAKRRPEGGKRTSVSFVVFSLPTAGWWGHFQKKKRHFGPFELSLWTLSTQQCLAGNA